MEHAPSSLRLAFSGSVALVTGAASGIGAATAKTLQCAGIEVIHLDRHVPDTVVRGNDHWVCADVGNMADLTATLHQELGAGPVDYVVNCAGVLRDTGFAAVPASVWEESLNVNLLGAYNVVECVRGKLESSLTGAVVNVTSVEAHRVVAIVSPDPTPHYAAAKAALSMLTKSTARAMARHGVRVNSVAPGFVGTPMTAHHSEGDSLPGPLESRVPLGRFGTATELASCIAFLLSDQASFVTGAELVVDGGLLLT